MAKDFYHETVKKALIKDGWTITHDPFRLEDKGNNMNYESDLGAEKMLAAEKGLDRIVVEIKSFLKSSMPNEFHTILGQYETYFDALEFLEYDRVLVLAIPLNAHERLQNYPFILHQMAKHKMKTFVFDEFNENIIVWKL